MILVTGGTGMLGSHLLYNLAVTTNSRIKAFKRKSSNVNNVYNIFTYYSPNASELFNKIQWISGDLLDKTSFLGVFDDVDYVYHCAATVSFKRKDKEKIYQNNVIGTSNLVNACLEHKIKKLCYVSSISAIGNASGKVLTTEQNLPNIHDFKSAYAHSKYLSELEVWRGIAEGIPAVIINPSVILGPGPNWDRGSASIFKAINKNSHFYTRGITGFVDVQDVCKIMILLMKSNIEKDRFIVSSENLSYKKLFEMIADSFGNKRPSVYAHSIYLEIARFFFSIASLFGAKQNITKETIKSAYSKTYYSNEKLKKVIPYKFCKIQKSIEEITRLYLLE